MNATVAVWLVLAVSLSSGGIAVLLQRRSRWHYPVALIGIALCAAIEAGRHWT